MILAIADDDVTGRRDGDTLQALEFTVTATPAAERLQERALWAEDLYSVVTGVCDDDVALVVDSDASWELELTLVGALGSEGGQHAPVHVEYLNTMVVAVADDHAVRVAHRDVVWMFQLATSASAGAEFAHERAVRLKHLSEQTEKRLSNPVRHVIAKRSRESNLRRFRLKRDSRTEFLRASEQGEPRGYVPVRDGSLYRTHK